MLAVTAAFFLGIQYGGSLIVGQAPLDVYAVMVGLAWLILLESVEWASMRKGGVVIDPRVLVRRRRFLKLEVAVGGLAAAVVVGAAAAVRDRGDPVLFILGVTSAVLAAAVVVTSGRRSVGR